MAVAHIALGSNLGDRRGTLAAALRQLDRRPAIRVVRTSTFVETAPVGGPDGQGAYLNAAAELDTQLAAGELLTALLDVEAGLGRVRAVRWGPRTLDLDLLLFGGLVCDGPTLTLPHPRMHERVFVLQPLAEIAADAVHPTLGRTVGELLAEATRR